MTPNVDDLIDDLKNLLNHFIKVENKTKLLVHESHELNKTIKLTKEVCDCAGIILILTLFFLSNSM